MPHITSDDAEAAARFFAPTFTCTMQLPGSPATTYAGLDGLRATWRDWLAPWASYRTEIEELIDAGERVVVLARDYGRREAGAPEVEQKNAAVWNRRWPSGRRTTGERRGHISAGTRLSSLARDVQGREREVDPALA
jgi:hypothetical protein